MKNGAGKSILLFLLLITAMGDISAQTCDSKYILNDYKGTTFLSTSKAAFTPENEIVVTGTMRDYNEAGYIAKFSKNGIPLWSNYYIIGFYDFINNIYFSKIKFFDFVLTDDGGMVVAGQTERYQFKQYALLAKISKYGSVEWTKTCYTLTGSGNLSFSSVYKTAEGDIIAYMANDIGLSYFYPVYSYNRVLCYSASGAFKWGTSLISDAFDAGGNGVVYKRGITQLANKNIVVGDVVCKSNKTTPVFKINDGRLHFYSLNYKTGVIEWESDYRYTLPTSDSTFIPDIESVSELPTGQLAFTTTLYLSTAAEPALTKKPVTIITSNKGVVQKLVTFYSPGNTCTLVDITGGNTGLNNYLFNVNGSSAISSVSNGETINSTQGYADIYPPNCFASGSRGYGIFLSNNNSLHYKLLLTDANGQAACAETGASVLTEIINPVTDNTEPVITNELIYTATSYKSYFLDYQYPLIKKSEYPLEQTIECEEQVDCCKDFVDSINIREVKLCEGSSYTLPDNNLVKDSGTYNVTYKTPAGCDSIIYYHIGLDKNLSALTLGNDTCLTDQTPIQLRVTGGYGTYNWMGTVSADTTYTIHATGLYWVKVTNICGTKTDSIHIYDQCDFPIYMPNAFTPNGDNLNDFFGVPAQNKNRLIEFKIFDRWGGVVFKTNQVAKRWDGKFKNQPLNTGVFAYYLVMEGLSGKQIIYKGIVTLIR